MTSTLLNRSVRGTLIGLTAAVGVAGLAACGTSASATPSSSVRPVSSRSSTMTFVAADEPGNMAMEDLGRKSRPGGVDLGDLIAFTQTLSTDGKPAGQVHVAAVGVDAKRHLAQATGTISLADGTIAVVGAVSMEPTFTLAVVGGTGKYAGESGTMDFDGSGAQQRITLHLQR